MKKADFIKKEIMRDEKIDAWLNDFEKYEKSIERIKKGTQKVETWMVEYWLNEIDKLISVLTSLEAKAKVFCHNEEKHRSNIQNHPVATDKNALNISIQLVYTWVNIWSGISNEIEELKNIKKELAKSKIIENVSVNIKDR